MLKIVLYYYLLLWLYSVLSVSVVLRYIHSVLSACGVIWCGVFVFFCVCGAFVFVKTICFQMPRHNATRTFTVPSLPKSCRNRHPKKNPDHHYHHSGCESGQGIPPCSIPGGRRFGLLLFRLNSNSNSNPQSPRDCPGRQSWHSFSNSAWNAKSR